MNRSAVVNSARVWLARCIGEGHSACCDRLWKRKACTCPGRTFAYGRARARELDREEEQARDYLLQVDPDARAWLASTED